MASKAKKQPTAPAAEHENQADPLQKRARSFLFRPRVLMAVALLVSSTVALPMVASRLPDLVHRDEYRLQTRDIEINAPPECVPGDVIERVARKAGLPEELSVLDDDLTATVADAFGRNAWVDRVVQVRKFVPARVRVRLEYRRPVAMVEVQQGLYPVDANGVLLPPEDFTAVDTRQFPMIKNVPAPPQGPAGTSWGDAAVVGAARLAERLGPHWKEFELAAVLVMPRSKADEPLEEIQYQLVTRGGSRILWGRTPSTGHPGELTVDQKIGRLKKYRADFGGFDQPHGPYEIDIRHWREISRRPLRRAAQSAWHDALRPD